MAGKKRDLRQSKFLFTCYECGISFQVLGILQDKRKARPFCPNCGEHWEVKSAKASRKAISEVKGQKPVRIKWSEQEIQWIDDIISGKKTPKQVANLTGRSDQSVYNRRDRRIEELKKRGQVERYG